MCVKTEGEKDAVRVEGKVCLEGGTACGWVLRPKFNVINWSPLEY